MTKSFLLLCIIPTYIVYVAFLMVMMFKRRVKATKAGHIKLSYFRTYQGTDINQDLVIIQNHFNNHFQLPVYFFITIVCFLHYQAVSTLTIILGYSFFASRLWHSYIHLGSNNVKIRALSYALGLVIILIMWLELLVSLSSSL